MTKNTYFLGLPCTLRNPGFRLVPGLVESEETCLSTTLDQLIGLCNEFGGEDPAWQLRIGCDGVGFTIPRHLGNFWSRIVELGLDLRMGGNCRRSLQPVGEEKLSVVFTDCCLIFSEKVCKMHRTERTLG